MFFCLAHTTQFTEPGFYYLRDGSVGHLHQGGSYVTLINPQTKDFTTVIETMVRKTLSPDVRYITLSPTVQS